MIKKDRVCSLNSFHKKLKASAIYNCILRAADYPRAMSEIKTEDSDFIDGFGARMSGEQRRSYFIIYVTVHATCTTTVVYG